MQRVLFYSWLIEFWWNWIFGLIFTFSQEGMHTINLSHVRFPREIFLWVEFRWISKQKRRTIIVHLLYEHVNPISLPALLFSFVVKCMRLIVIDTPRWRRGGMKLACFIVLDTRHTDLSYEFTDNKCKWRNSFNVIYRYFNYFTFQNKRKFHILGLNWFSKDRK